MNSFRLFRIFATLLAILSLGFPSRGVAQADNPNPPDTNVKLIFIHHSSGENWLLDDHGGLALELQKNNYFVSDTNYGWGPESIGDRTDINNWTEWFRSDMTPIYMNAIYNESSQNSGYSRILEDPGGENEIILFKSCFPNSNLEGNPGDPPARGDGLTVSNAKYIYNDLLNYFITRPNKLFIVITAPPVQDPTYGTNARAFNDWLVNDWLIDNNYPYSNVAVFDFYNVLTDPANHHRYHNGTVEHITEQGGNNLYYPTDGDDHANPAGTKKATEELVPLLNVFYHRWVDTRGVQPEELTPTIAVVKPTEGEGGEVDLATNTPEVVAIAEVEDTETPTQAAVKEEGEKGNIEPEKKEPRLCPLPIGIGLLMVVMVSIESKCRHRRRL